MKKATRDIVFPTHSAKNAPQFTVEQDEVFLAETELCSGNWLNSEADIWAPHKTNMGNPTVCVAVEGAKAGDLLAVNILDIIPDKVGYTGFTSNTNPLVNKVMIRDWGINTKTLRIDSEYVYWSDKIKLPVAPMIGTLGTAPKVESLFNAKAGKHGGNMDVQEVCKGSVIYLPVEVDGALLHIGDVHAIQGDGEINCSGGVECRSTVKLSVQVIKRPDCYKCVRIEDGDYIMTVACERSVEESFYLALEQLVLWINDEYKMPINDAYLLLGQVLEARSTQFVNPTRTYICKAAKKYLEY